MYFDYNETGLKLFEKVINVPAFERQELIDLNKMNNEQIRQFEKQGTLCWYCDHAYNADCPKFCGFKSINGWIVKMQELETNNYALHVYDCPMYRRLVRKYQNVKQNVEPVAPKNKLKSVIVEEEKRHKYKLVPIEVKK